jgi:hypothetical protein
MRGGCVRVGNPLCAGRLTAVSGSVIILPTRCERVGRCKLGELLVYHKIVARRLPTSLVAPGFDDDDPNIAEHVERTVDGIFGYAEGFGIGFHRREGTTVPLGTQDVLIEEALRVGVAGNASLDR